jgi:two-component system sensor histidine kinase QseC
VLEIKSIKRFLLVGILGSLTIVSLLNAVHIFKESRQEVEELFDAELAQMARILQSVINASLASNPDAKSLSYLDNDVLNGVFGDEEYTELAHKYEQKLAFQVWDETGKIFFENHLNLPGQEGELGAGFKNLEAGDYSWRSFTIQDKKERFWIRTSQREDVRSELTNDIAFDTIIPNLLMIPVLFVVLGWVINLGLSPLKKISRALKARDHNNLKHIEQSSYPDELRVLLNELNDLFSRVSSAYERERRFTADAAHELRTPLAVSKVHLQNIQDTTKEDSTRNFVAKSLSGVERLIHMVQQLLILSRLDASQDQSEKTAIRVGRLVDELIKDLKQVPGLATQNIIASADHPISWEFDETQLRILLRNLLDNAARYAFENSVVVVHITENAIEVRNHCAELSSEQLAHLTQRFTRGSSNKQGSGLGLSICQQICDLNGLEMSIHNRSDDSTGVRMEVKGFN